MITAQNGKGSRARKVNGDKYRASKLWDKKGEVKESPRATREQAPPSHSATPEAHERPGKGYPRAIKA